MPIFKLQLCTLSGMISLVWYTFCSSLNPVQAISSRKPWLSPRFTHPMLWLHLVRTSTRAFITLYCNYVCVQQPQQIVRFLREGGVLFISVSLVPSTYGMQKGHLQIKRKLTQRLVIGNQIPWKRSAHHLQWAPGWLDLVFRHFRGRNIEIWQGRSQVKHRRRTWKKEAQSVINEKCMESAPFQLRVLRCESPGEHSKGLCV